MPGLLDCTEHLVRKRKRDERDALPAPTAKASRSGEGEGTVEVDVLENQILESRRYYNNIAILIDYVRHRDTNVNQASLAIVALCRIFSRLMASGMMEKPGQQVESEVVITDWLNERFYEYRALLMDSLADGRHVEQKACLELLMQLSKEEAACLNLDGDLLGRRGTFPMILQVLTTASCSDQVRGSFVENYLQKFDDIIVFTFRQIANILADSDDSTDLNGLIFVMIAIKPAPWQKEHGKDIYYNIPKANSGLCSAKAQKRAAQDAWILVLKGDITKAQRKTLLGVMSHRVVPWFARPELLMDFLTDSFDVGGSTSLMALSGLFSLVQEKNLDYPQFYTKLYSLLDPHILHSKHRSRFLRLLDTSLASTHLPALLVASFIKRLGRLCLHAPPSAIVAILPWIYNLFKKHPTCTFMIHREVHGADMEETLVNPGMKDPFRMDETDPIGTGAIDSSLWEIETLQSHYHPNVATIARIISEQFTKQGYSVEDFLDHSYGSMLDAELSKPNKKKLVVEYEIPRKVFTYNDEPSSDADRILMQLWDFSS
ncbi:hypothetical protein MMC30_008800 [Trapelia coarctata]|nr:hypothetical protein [Trapelia coarctata]